MWECRHCLMQSLEPMKPGVLHLQIPPESTPTASALTSTLKPLFKPHHFTQTNIMHANPFAQGWLQGGNNGAQLPPSILGALPSFPPNNQMLTFRFAFNASIRNSTVYGPTQQPTLTVTTTPTQPAQTRIRNLDGTTIGTIDWLDPIAVEIPGYLTRQDPSRWFSFNHVQNYRNMVIGGNACVWRIIDGSVCLYPNATCRDFIARITMTKQGVTLELNAFATQRLLAPCIVATVLLMSGHNIP